jgi:hypothetical protein
MPTPRIIHRLATQLHQSHDREGVVLSNYATVFIETRSQPAGYCPSVTFKTCVSPLWISTVFTLCDPFF